QIEHETIATDDADYLCEPVPVESSISEDPRRHDDMRRAGREPPGGVISGNTAAELKSAGKSAQRFARRRFVSRPQQDAVSAGQLVSSIKLSEPGRRAIRNVVGFRTSGSGVERAADDLLYFTFMQVNARTEHGLRLKVPVEIGKAGVVGAGRSWSYFR